MNGQTCVITGATSGIGRAAALALGKLGAHLALLGRNESAGEAAVRRIRARGSKAEFFRTDLSILSEVREAARRITQRYSQIDVLINNAGARFDKYQRSADGFELTFATNHLSHFLLTSLLADSLLAAPAARVLTVSSRTHAAAVADGLWQLSPTAYNRHQAYARSKLANVLFAYELADRLKGTTATSNVVDPGIVATNFGRNNGLLSWSRHLVYHGMRGELVSAQRACQAIVFLADADSVRTCTGQYFHENQPLQSAKASYDRDLSRDLWNMSLSWTGLNGDVVPRWDRMRP